MPGVTSRRRRWLSLYSLTSLASGGRGPDDAHVAAQDVEELRQLVERILAQEAAHARDARVVGDLEQHAVALVHVHDIRRGASRHREPWCGT